jgi:hypothetical protein
MSRLYNTPKSLTNISGRWGFHISEDCCELAKLNDVDLTNLMDGDILIWNSTTNMWENGTIPAAPEALNDLTDVTISAVTDGDMLVYDGTSMLWENVPQPAIPDVLNDLSDVTVTAPSDCQILKYDGTGMLWKNENFNQAIVPCNTVVDGTLLPDEVDDYSPTGYDANTSRIEIQQPAVLPGASSITGMVNYGQCSVCIYNATASNSFEISHEDTGSLAANRFHLPSNYSQTVYGGQSIEFEYIDSRWRVKSFVANEAGGVSCKKMLTAPNAAATGASALGNRFWLPNGSDLVIPAFNFVELFYIAGSWRVSTSALPTQNQLMCNEITPPALTVDTDDYNPTGLATATVIILDASAAINLTGIVSGNQCYLVLYNNSTFNIKLIKEGAGSALANRFSINPGGGVNLQPQEAINLFYSTTISRWVLVSHL